MRRAAVPAAVAAALAWASPALAAPVALAVVPTGGAEQVRAVLGPALSAAAPPRTLAEVEQQSERLTAALRQGGFPLGQVLMTEEDWARAQAGGEAVFTAFPGRVSRIVVENRSRVRDATLDRLVAQAMCARPVLGGGADCLFEARRFERATQLLQGVPGVGLEGAPRFGPGAATGDVEATFAIAERGKPWSVDASVDNNGLEATGRTRFTASARANNLLGSGDAYGASLTVTTEHMWTGALNASTPILSDGLRLAGDFTRQQYAVNVAGTSFAGTANTASLGLTYPFARGLDFNMWGAASYLHSQTSVDYTEFDVSNHGQIDAFKLSVSADSGDRAQQLRTSLWSASGAVTLGQQDNDNPLDVGPGRAGTYGKVAGSAFGRLGLSASSDLFATARLSAQLASRNLDPSEQLTLGGPFAVRAYRADEGMADEGLILSLGLYKRFAVATGHQLQFGPTMDFAVARVNADPWDGWERTYVGVPDVGNTRRLAGYGAEIAWLTPFGFTVSASAAKPFGFSDGSWIEPGERPVQYWLSLSWAG